MALTPTIFRSTDPGMPSLTGEVGAGYQTCKHILLALGWSLVYEYPSGQRGVFRSDAVSGSGGYLEIDDTGSGTGGAKEMLVYMWESYDAGTQTGSDRVPTTTQLSAGKTWHKSFSASSTARAWRAIGNDRSFYLQIDSNGAGISLGAIVFAGDINSWKTGDQHNYGLVGAVTQNLATSSVRSTMTPSPINNDVLANNQRFYVARNYLGAPGAVLLNFTQHITTQTVFGGLSTAIAYPDPVAGGLIVDQLMLHEGIRTPRGTMPGVYVPLHNNPLTDDTEHTGIIGLPGTTLLAWTYRHTANSANTNGQLCFVVGEDW